MGNLTVLEGGRGHVVHSEGREAALKRLAMQIVLQLPEQAEEAIEVLEHAKSLVESFMSRSRPF